MVLFILGVYLYFTWLFQTVSKFATEELYRAERTSVKSSAELPASPRCDLLLRQVHHD